MTEPETPASQPFFRPSKRRKVIRERRPSSSEDEQTSRQTHNAVEKAAQSGITADKEESESDRAVVVQKIRKPRTRLGLDVSNSSTRAERSSTTGNIDQERSVEEIHTIGKRFALQTGLVKDDLDKHM
jgi:hypothetical protein